jgi:hypothetical protein
MDKGQRFYAESIEARLVGLNMSVDVLFPNPNAPLNKVLANITSRGVVYAIVITPMNEVHSSVTINILQGQQQEHRNMPLDSAMEFIAKSYQNILNLKAKTGMGLGNAQNKSTPGVFPSDIRNIVGFIKEQRAMSVMEYDKLIKFLAQRREEVIKKEYGDDIPAHLLEPNLGKPIDPVVKSKQEEVLAKIRRVLHAHGDLAKPTPPAEAATPPVSTPALAPSLQQALDSLIRTGPNLLTGKSAAPPSAAPPAVTHPPTVTYPPGFAPQASAPPMAFPSGMATATAAPATAPVPSGAAKPSAASAPATLPAMSHPAASALQPRPLFPVGTPLLPFARAAARPPAGPSTGPAAAGPRSSTPRAPFPPFRPAAAPPFMPYPAGFTNPLFAAAANYLPPTRTPTPKGPPEVINALQRPPPPPPQQTQHRPNAPVRPSLYPHLFSGY